MNFNKVNQPWTKVFGTDVVEQASQLSIRRVFTASGSIHDMEAYEGILSDVKSKHKDITSLILTENPTQRKMRRLRHEIVEVVFESLRLENFQFTPSE